MTGRFPLSREWDIGWGEAHSLPFPFRRKPESHSRDSENFPRSGMVACRRMRLSPQRFRLSPEWKEKEKPPPKEAAFLLRVGLKSLIPACDIGCTPWRASIPHSLPFQLQTRHQGIRLMKIFVPRQANNGANGRGQGPFYGHYGPCALFYRLFACGC